LGFEISMKKAFTDFVLYAFLLNINENVHRKFHKIFLNFIEYTIEYKLEDPKLKDQI